MAMNIKEIKQLIKLMIDNELTELDIASGDDKVKLKRGSNHVPMVTIGPSVSAAPAAPPQEAAEVPQAPSEELIEIKSPMVGTFYAASSPDSEPYVQVGDLIGPESVVCVVEAMKVMNEIKAECSGTIAEVCVNNAQPVEFAQVLFRVKVS